MPRRENRGMIQTVLGPVSRSDLGPTTMHEHVYADFSGMLRPAQDSPSPELAEAPIRLGHLGWIRRNYYSNRSNLELVDLDTTVREVAMYRNLGGGAIVDATTTGIGRNPAALARISRESGVHIIMGAGFYVGALHPEGMDERSVDDLALEIVSDLTDGVDRTGIKAGIIGEIGCTWPLTTNERKSLQAAAIALLADTRNCPDADTKTVRSWPPKLSASGQFLQCPIPLIPPHCFSLSGQRQHPFPGRGLKSTGYYRPGLAPHAHDGATGPPRHWQWPWA